MFTEIKLKIEKEIIKLKTLHKGIITAETNVLEQLIKKYLEYYNRFNIVKSCTNCIEILNKTDKGIVLNTYLIN